MNKKEPNPKVEAPKNIHLTEGLNPTDKETTSWFIRFFEQCFFLGHKWDMKERINVFDTSYGADPKYPATFKYVMQCRRCGDIMTRSSDL